MLRKLRKAALTAATCLVMAGLAFGQMGTFTGKVIGEDGKGIQGAVIKIERKDIKGNWNTKTNKKGEWTYSGMPVPGQFVINCEINGQVVDAVNGIRSQMGEPQEVIFDLRKMAAQRQAAQKAAETGQISQELAKEMTPEQKAAYEKQLKERSAQMQKNKALNDAYNAGMTAKEAKDYPTAIESFKKAGELDPKQSAVWIQLAATHDLLAKTQSGADKEASLNSAAENYLKALELQPADAGLHNNYGLVLAAQKKIPEAKAELEKAVSLEPAGGGKYMFNLGAVLINTGQTDPAVEAFRKATELDPKYAPAWFQFCSALSGKMTLQGDKPVAPAGMKEACEKYLELDPTGPNVEAAKGLLQLVGGTIETNFVNPDAKKGGKKAPKK
ncbi:tetratricopeptide repeat protein [Paludibaculum fermentans]|uniref:tetratricopeptide repeat protein n=1 Tax=Paludibaculum fermentans TaxID=1473598 RepID=UPI003EBC4829